MPGVLRLLPLQGALLAAFIPRALPWAKSFSPFRACCLLELLTLQGVLLIRAPDISGHAAYQSFDTSGRMGQTCGSSIIYKGTRAQRYEMQTRKMSKSVAECRLSHDLTKRFVTP